MVSSKAATVADYLAELPADRRAEIEKVRDLVNAALPAGYREGMAWGLIGWVVPLEVHPDTYNKQPLLYAGLGAHKNYNSLYLTCVYASKERTERLKAAAAEAGKKLDMGKSCIHFRRAEDLPLDHIHDEIASTAPDKFIKFYEEARRSGSC
ncbi:DUF1801 domain-containing protein [Sphingomonas alba]|uniref:DUF1801 domain-containing protein n=1 Tax=Sphingomonas alba TaxID=2908208 RepID=A0ABT0RLZ9_9SPHN|nr:DUF1801 domain-containing protein [Sphingomonas alba]